MTDIPILGSNIEENQAKMILSFRIGGNGSTASGVPTMPKYIQEIDLV